MSTQRQQVHNKNFWTEFFYLYESLPVLWNVNNPSYKIRKAKCDAYDILVNKLREIEPNCVREDVLRKINIFRTNFRRECTRIATSIEEGRQYQSTLWYFNLLCFLQTADTRRERKRKLDDDGEKSIMRKRRTKNMIPNKSTDQYITPQKEHLIEYHPNSSNVYEYDLEEKNDFDYVSDDIAHSLVDGNSDNTNNTTEIQQNPLQIKNHNNYEEDEDDDETSQQEYNQEFQNYCLQRNYNKKIKTSSEIVPVEESIEMKDDNEQHEFEEYVDDNNDDTVATHQWCIKDFNTQNSQLQQKQGLVSSTQANTSKTNEISSMKSTKCVRHVKTMTSSKFQTFGGCSSKLSESSEILAKSWAIQYDELTQQQKLLARKAINDILFEGCMGNLVIEKNGRITAGNIDYTSLKSKDIVRDEGESGQVHDAFNMSTSPSSSKLE